MITIEKGIPVPEAKLLPNRQRREQHAEIHDTVSRLDPGDSFIVPEKYISANNSFWMRQQLEKSYGIRLVQRRMPEGIRIWRTA